LHDVDCQTTYQLLLALLLLLLLFFLLLGLGLHPRPIICLVFRRLLLLLRSGALALLLAVVASKDIVVLVLEVGFLRRLARECVCALVCVVLCGWILALEFEVGVLVLLLFAAALQSRHEAAATCIVAGRSVVCLGLLSTAVLGRDGLAHVGVPVLLLRLLVTLLLRRHRDCGVVCRGCMEICMRSGSRRKEVPVAGWWWDSLILGSHRALVVAEDRS
jgi:hypothetical protein